MEWKNITVLPGKFLGLKLATLMERDNTKVTLSEKPDFERGLLFFAKMQKILFSEWKQERIGISNFEKKYVYNYTSTYCISNGLLLCRGRKLRPEAKKVLFSRGRREKVVPYNFSYDDSFP